MISIIIMQLIFGLFFCFEFWLPIFLINSVFFSHRAINKLYEIRVKNAEDNIRLRLSTSNKTAICITNKQELITFIYMPKKDLLELNISGFQFNQHLNQILKQCRRQQTLLFIINKEIDLDDNIKLLINDHDKQQYDLVFLRKFIQLYRLTSYALKFV